MKRIFSILIFVIIAFAVSAQNISNKSTRLIDNWQFIKQDVGGIWEVLRPVKPGRPETVPIWTNVCLPHCFNATDAVDPNENYYQGPGWYRTELDISGKKKGERVLLHFEGAGQKTEVYIGLQKVATHVGGYDEWYVDITDYVNQSLNDTVINEIYKSKIPLSIRCDNTRDLEMIPSNLSDFNVYGGLYRYVNLMYVPETYITQVHANTSFNGRSLGNVSLEIDIQNLKGRNIELTIELRDAEDKNVYSSNVSTTNNKLEHNFSIKRIKKWSTENPNLYKLIISTIGENGGQVYSDNIGFREFKFEKHGPFYLNGKRLLLQGTHRHEDHAGVAAAMTEEMIREEMLLMKNMGVNFIRLGHYQQSRIVLNLCDSLGILVWEEIPWCRGGLGGSIYEDQARRMLTNMINQHYNHPSIIIWGLGNENDWPGDFPEYSKVKIQDFMRELHNLSHSLDETRKTGIRRCDFCKDIVDVYSPSIWAGWYRGKFTEYKKVSLKNMKEVNHFFHMEWGGSSHSGRHDENPDKGLENIRIGQGADERDGDASLMGGKPRVSRDGNWSETYICNLFDWHLKEQLSMPWLTGTAQWTFKDFSTPVRPNNPIPYMNQKGVVQRDLTPKESYYVFQSYWADKPMVHIYGHNWPIRWGKEGQKKIVKVYSNCKKVELFLNGESLGVKKRSVENYPASGLFWNVQFTKGKNQLIAKAFVKDKHLIDTVNLKYQTEQWGDPASLQIEESPIDKNYSWLKVKVLDGNNVQCLDARIVVDFFAIGDVELIKNQGTVDGSKKIELSNGKARIKVRKTGSSYCLGVKSMGFETKIILKNKKYNNLK